MLKSFSNWQIPLLRIEHSKFAYIADFIVYIFLILGLFTYFIKSTNLLDVRIIIALVVFGFISWTFAEYILHRWVLHHITPFSFWHWEHHHRPKALICTATVVSASAIFLTIYLPLRLISDIEISNAYTLGLVIGYFIYALTHHAIHHWRYDFGWFNHRKEIHRLHHAVAPHTNFGVTFGIWDYVFQTEFKRHVATRSGH
jgi:sterol desaturase/sphingolipid hydroxylase (fatty acid hydroxylase superfamily)